MWNRLGPNPSRTFQSHKSGGGSAPSNSGKIYNTGTGKNTQQAVVDLAAESESEEERYSPLTLDIIDHFSEDVLDMGMKDTMTMSKRKQRKSL